MSAAVTMSGAASLHARIGAAARQGSCPSSLACSAQVHQATRLPRQPHAGSDAQVSSMGCLVALSAYIASPGATDARPSAPKGLAGPSALFTPPPAP